METKKTDGKTAATISYLWIIGVIVAFYMNNDEKHPFASFHIRQSLGFWLTYMVFGYFFLLFVSCFLSTPFFVFFGVLFLYGIGTAITGKMYPMPLVGKLYQNAFKNL